MYTCQQCRKNNNNEDKLPDLEKLRDTRLRYLKQPLFAYLNKNSLRNKLIDLKEIAGYLSPDYLVSRLSSKH